MDKGIINADGSRNWQANILLDNVKRLEQENAELKAENDRLKECNEELTSDNLNTIQEMDNERRRVEQLKEENEQLKEDYMELYQQKDLDNAKWQKRCTDLHIEDKAKADKYWLVLQEIKEITEKLMADDLCNNCDGIGLDANCQDTGCPYYQMDRILNLITKAESEG